MQLFQLCLIFLIITLHALKLPSKTVPEIWGYTAVGRKIVYTLLHAIKLDSAHSQRTLLTAVKSTEYPLQEIYDIGCRLMMSEDRLEEILRGIDMHDHQYLASPTCLADCKIIT